MKDVREAIIGIRNAKLPDPATITVPLTEGEDTAVFQFAEIKYDLSDMVDGNGERVYEKEFRYIISEDAAMAGTTVLLGENTLNVKVTDQLDGTLKIEKTYSNGDQVLFINTRENTVIIRKTDTADGRALEGAAFRITDSEGSVVDEWVSSREEAHVIKGLKTNEEYILHETAAPHGYGIATDTTFTFDGQGNVVSTGTVTYDEEGNWILLVKDDMFKVSASVKKIWDDDNNKECKD